MKNFLNTKMVNTALSAAVSVVFLSVMGCTPASDTSASTNGTAGTNAGTAEVSPAAKGVVAGFITFSGAESVPADAKITVTLNDTSLADASAKLLSSYDASGNSAFPIAFTLPYDSSAIQLGFDYTVSARIEQGEKLLFINDTSIPVLDTQGKIDNGQQGVELPVIAIPAR